MSDMQSQTICGATRLISLIGNPVAHSISPQIHNHALKTLGLPFVYVPLGVPNNALHTVITALRALSFAGANITVPHKQRVLPLCDVLSPLSTITGAVNTLYVKDGLLYGTTTDAEGFFRALSWMGHNPKKGAIVILGNGGVARTLAFAFALDHAIERLTLIGRDSAKVSALAREVSQRANRPIDYAVFSDTVFAQHIKGCSLLVNCTSIGMHPNANASPIDAGLLHDKITVFDTVYNPGTTKLLTMAKQAGCARQNGLRMLLYQGLASFRLWTGVEVPESIFNIEELQQIVDKI